MYYNQTTEDLISLFKSDKNSGLSAKDILLRAQKYGLNVLPPAKKQSIFFKFLSQFNNLLVIILLIATLVSYFLGETVDAMAIAAIVMINALIGFIQELNAQKTLESLKSKEINMALVVRSATVAEIPVAEIVPGDILLLEEGSLIPADGRIFESFSLRVDESILTGESINVSKNHDLISEENTDLADRINMVYKDTKVVAGRGKALVVATGKDTQIGRIAAILRMDRKDKTPLTLELEKVGRTLSLVIGIIAVLIFLANILTQKSLVESLLVSISLAVAAIPEGLPAIVTIVLSIGVKRLAEKKTLVKKLPAVETLGAIRIIATDKTGTITQNKINVAQVLLPNGIKYNIEGVGYQTKGTFFDQYGHVFDPRKNSTLEILLSAGVLASNAKITEAENQSLKIIGDTTEVSLLVAARRANLNPDNINAAHPRLYELPFSAERKMMSVVVDINQTGQHMLYAKGAPEVILENCVLDRETKKQILSQVDELAGRGLRSLCLGRKKISKSEVKQALEEEKLEESGLEYLGLLGMHDPLRLEVKEALLKAKQAGIRTIMITGDHQETASSIAREAGIINRDEQIMTEKKMVKLSDHELMRKIEKGLNVFARISPLGKLRIIRAIKRIPYTQIAVTGDGVNDTPALKEAHIGVAMGKTGTDLAKDVADIIITDDNYATIVDAIREGRVIFANLVKFIRYLISCNLSEVVVVTLGVIFNTPLPLLPIQLLWINLITDGMPALALGLDPAEPDIMNKAPRDLKLGILHKRRWSYMLIEGGIIGASVFILFVVTIYRTDYLTAQTMTFTALSLAQLVHAFNNRSTRISLFKLGILSNKYLLGAAFISLLLQLFVVYSVWGNYIFKTNPLTQNAWLYIGIVALVPFVVSEAKKLLLRRSYL